jgi:hypothetical protein
MPDFHQQRWLDMMQLIIALVILVVSLIAFRLALPVDGRVRPYLRNHDFQAYYTVVLVLGMAVGLLSSVISLVELFG